ncbi:hypothetical protein [Cryptosporangium sp. NPDC051539]|uniref:hypothetical protein n=1 Tax=Cryptosporangium sp. NPDC051539 TaxID=3363962 RepID=UPI0037AE7515
MTAAEAEWLAWYQAGVTAGYAQGRTDAERDMAEAWTPVAERIRASAGQATWAQLLAARDEHQAPDGSYRANPVADDYTGGPASWPDPVDRASHLVKQLQTATGRRRAGSPADATRNADQHEHTSHDVRDG